MVRILSCYFGTHRNELVNILAHYVISFEVKFQFCGCYLGSSDADPGPATGFGWHDPGFVHTAILTGLSPSMSYEYQYGRCHSHRLKKFDYIILFKLVGSSGSPLRNEGVDYVWLQILYCTLLKLSLCNVVFGDVSQWQSLIT